MFFNSVKEKKEDSILYLIHINWQWIIQRPQFIAEGLACKYKVYVVYRHSYKTKGYQSKREKIKNLYFNEIYGLPNRLNKYDFFNRINLWLFKRKIKEIIKKHSPKCIYITGPSLYQAIPKNYSGKVIYDCMDDHLALHNDPHDYEVRDEKRLIKRANNIIVTSQNLENVILKRYSSRYKNKIFLVRNGFAGPILGRNDNKIQQSTKITYFGTVSHWLDFSILQQSLKDFPKIEYDIYGPVDNHLVVPKNSRIRFLGTVEHDELNQIAKQSIALIMPFKVNKIIKSVDPVKLYEYINFNKNIIAVKYPEIERFNDFVYFYNGYFEYKKQLTHILNNPSLKYSQQQRKDFLRQNSWNSRVNKIIDIIEEK